MIITVSIVCVFWGFQESTNTTMYRQTLASIKTISSVLGPLFFLIYINDISKGLSEGTKLKLFADDSLLYRTIKSSTDSAILQKDLDTLQIWEEKWKN